MSAALVARIATTCLALALALSLAPSAAAALSCTSEPSFTGLVDTSGARFDGIEATFTPRWPFSGVKAHGQDVAAIIAIGATSRLYAAFSLLAVTNRGWAPALEWRGKSAHHSRWLTGPDGPRGWNARAPHRLGLVLNRSSGRWTLLIDGKGLGSLDLGETAGGLSQPVVLMKTSGGAGACETHGVVRFTGIRVRRAGGAGWVPFPGDARVLEAPGFDAERHGSGAFVAKPGAERAFSWGRLFGVEAGLAFAFAGLLFLIWGVRALRPLRGRRYPERDVGLLIRLAAALFFLALLYVPLFALGVLLVLGATGSTAAAAVAAIFELCFALGLPLLAEAVTSLKGRVRPLRPHEHSDLHRLVIRLAALADVPTPRIGISSSPVPVAWATGRGRRAMIVVTEALLGRLETHELEAVLAHEVAHIEHGDAYVLTLLNLPEILGGIVLRPIAAFPDRFENGFLRWSAIAVVAGVLGPIFFLAWIPWTLAGLVVANVSRYREFAADRSAAILTGSPENLISALVSLRGDLEQIPTRDLRSALALNALFVVPLPAARARFSLDPARLFPTHPSHADRVARLEESARQLGHSRRQTALRRRLRSGRRPGNLAANVVALAGVGNAVLLATADPFARGGAAAVLVFASGVGLVLAFYAIGRAQAGARGFAAASAGLALFLVPWLVAVAGALSYFVVLFLHLDA